MRLTPRLNRKITLLWTLLFLSVTASSLEAKTVEKEIYGRYETISIVDFNGVNVSAKMDTGALTASLHAENIEFFTKNNDDWVRFTTRINEMELGPYEFPLHKVSRVKWRQEEKSPSKVKSAKRPVILLTLCLGNQQKEVEVNLANRSNLNYPLLIGSKALRSFKAIVDVSEKYTHPLQCNE